MIKKINELKNWEKNPRGIKTGDFERLKNQIKRLGIYKPLLINKDNVVLGGNMRLRAYKELGIEEVEVIEVDAQEEAKMLEYALSDNDKAGYYEQQDLAELLTNYKTELTLPDYKINLSPEIDLARFLEVYNQDFTDINLEWEGMPEFKQEKIGFKQIMVTFANEDDMNKFSKLVEQKITRTTKSIWYPEQELQSRNEKVYVEE